MANWLVDREQRRVSVRRSLFPALLVFLFLPTLCVEQFEVIVFLEPLERLRTALEKPKLFVKQFCVASGLSLCSFALNIKNWRTVHYFPLSDNPRSLKSKSELCGLPEEPKLRRTVLGSRASSFEWLLWVLCLQFRSNMKQLETGSSLFSAVRQMTNHGLESRKVSSVDPQKSQNCVEQFWGVGIWSILVF